jgi:cyclase
MKTLRIIPRLDIKGPNLVKGIHLEGLRVLGDPSRFAKFYYENGADELIFVDVVASLYQRNSLTEIIKNTANDIFIPLTVGGGIRTINDIKNVLRAGADKVAINTAAINNPEFIKIAAREFGSSTIVISVEVIRHSNGDYYCFTDNGREITGINAFEWIKKVQDFGAGEILLTSIDKEGTKKGLDLELINSISKITEIPLIVHGGIGRLEDLEEGFKFNIDAISLSSVLHYNFIDNNNFSLDVKEGNIEFLKKNHGNKKNEISIDSIKKFLIQKSLKCRI